jgi:very-short-patch-repair endonuclease
MPRHIEERLAELTARQHGVVTRRQLVRLGFTPRAIQGRLESGRMRLLHRGVYLEGPVEPLWARVMAAVLASGPGARASHRAAASLWELGPGLGPASRVEVKVPGGRVVRRPGIRAYRCVGLETSAPATVHGIPTTDPVETLLDLAANPGPLDLENMVARGERFRLVTLDELAAAVDRHPKCPGMATLRSLLGQSGGPAFTRSELEQLFRDALRRFHLPAPRFNTRVHGYEVDCYWPDAGVAIELDGRAYHDSWKSRRNDRRRDRELVARGIHVIRITWPELVHETEPTMARVIEALAVGRERLRR